ncbi:unnamed protein product [Anisakis simplex]|uniref:BppU_N domain-containing protein n=1 Tax=Anisakis simplex TaxID=6269 RepID=A0A0M3J049_ANISI|nr:unnamed protein product [Anisakis simplex]
MNDLVLGKMNMIEGVSGELHYEEHKEYVYDTTSTATLKVPQGKYQSVVTQRARAHIVKHSPCEFSLKVFSLVKY